MTTVALSQAKHPERTRQQDRLFFSGIVLLVLIAVSVGFARTYFLAGAFWAKLPSVMVHVHGALFTLWIALLVAQVALVASRRTCWHMRLGIAGMFLAPLMVITGFATLIAAIKRSFVPLPVLQIIAAQDILLLCLFVFLISWAFLARRDPPTHKRLVLCATFLIIIPAIARWPIMQNIEQHLVVFYTFVNCFPALLVLYDLWTRRSLHRATICGVVLMIALQLAVPILAPVRTDRPHNRLAAENLTGAENPIHFPGDLTLQRFGPERAAIWTPLNSLIRAGVPLVIASESTR